MATSTTVERSVQSGTASEAVVSAVAELTGTDPLSLEPLYDTVDPDALNSLFETDRGFDRSPRRVTFTYSGCNVVVSADGEVQVSRSDENPHKVGDYDDRIQRNPDDL